MLLLLITKENIGSALKAKNYPQQIKINTCFMHLLGPTSISAINTAEGKKRNYLFF